MPNGVPVATVALNASKNAGLLAIQMLAISDPFLADKYTAFKAELEDKVAEMSQETKGKFPKQ
jgi:5-(carboxyamino)imidazole ribonucleotide mutase